MAIVVALMALNGAACGPGRSPGYLPTAGLTAAPVVQLNPHPDAVNTMVARNLTRQASATHTAAPQACLTLDAWQAALSNPAPIPTELNQQVLVSARLR